MNTLDFVLAFMIGSFLVAFVVANVYTLYSDIQATKKAVKFLSNQMDEDKREQLEWFQNMEEKVNDATKDITKMTEMVRKMKE